MKNLQKLLILAVVALVLTGCGLSNKPTEKNDGGVWKSVDNGRQWQQKSAIATSNGQRQGFVTLDSVALTMDPSDHNALYYGSLNQGLFYSYDDGNSWQIARTLGKRPVGSIAIDAKDKCNIYVASISKIFKSTDCSRTWKEIYADNDPGQLINTIVVDHYNPQIVYMGNKRGDIIRSADGGDSWETLHNFKGRIKKIILSPADSRIIFVMTENKGLFRSLNSGIDWLDLKENMPGIRNTQLGRDVVASAIQPGLVIYATKYGMLRSVNNGDDWTEIKLIVPKNESRINSIAISDLDANKLYYLTDTVFYSSADGGVNWISQDLTTTRRGANLVVDSVKPGVIYFAPIQRQ